MRKVAVLLLVAALSGCGVLKNVRENVLEPIAEAAAGIAVFGGFLAGLFYADYHGHIEVGTYHPCDRP